MATDCRVVGITRLPGMDVGAADSAQLDVDHDAVCSGCRVRNFDEFDGFLAGDQRSVHGEIVAHVRETSRMIIIAGTIDFANKDDRDKAVEIGTPLQAAGRTEPGCLAYSFAPDPCEDTRIQVYELWTDEAALAAHFQHENYFNMGGALRDCGIIGADNRKYRVDLSEPVYDDTHTPRADFFTA